MPFRLLNEYNQKKLSTAMLSLPVFVFLLGVGITLLLVNAFHQSEVKFKQENLKSTVREYSKIQNLVLSNSILRIQSYNEISNLVHADSQIQKRIVKEIISSTMFSRASLFVLDKKPGQDGLPSLTMLQKIQTDHDPMPIGKTRQLQSTYLRQKIQKMLSEDLANTLALTHNDEVDTLSLIWHSTSNKNEFIIFSSTLEAFFKDAPNDPELTAVIYDTDTDLALSIHQDISTPYKFIQEKNPELPPKNRFLLYNHYLVSDFYGISIHWFQTAKNTYSFYVIMVALFGAFISLLSALFLRFILEQNRRIYTLVVSRTEQLELAMNHAQEANLAKTRFLANMSHELRTPLNLILGMIELQQLNNIDKKSLEYLKNMQTAGEHLLNLITDLLSMSKEEVSDLKVNRAPINIPIFFEEIAAIISPECRKKNLAFSLLIGHDVPAALTGDPVKIRQILINLLRNSLKYTHHGHLSLQVELVAKESLQKNICYLRFKVHDTGVGIPKNKMNQIFDRFFQLESSKMLTEGGVGLGLSIVKDLVSKMNGNIIVKSELGQGSTFTVDLDLELREEKTWISKFQVSPNTLTRVAAITEDLTLFKSLLEIIPNSVFQVESVSPDQVMQNLSPVDLAQMQALLVLSPSVNLISTLQKLYPDKKIIIFGNETSLEKIKSLKNIYLLNDCPILPTQLFDLLEFRQLAPVKKKLSPSDSSSVEGKASALAPDRKISALVVDDDAGNRQLMKAYLDDPKFTTSFASDGDEAFEMFKLKRPDIVIADLRMPRMNGFKLSEAITQFEQQHFKDSVPTPFILLTADALESTSDESKKYAISLFLTKPIRRTKIMQAIFDLTQTK